MYLLSQPFIYLSLLMDSKIQFPSCIRKRVRINRPKVFYSDIGGGYCLVENKSFQN